MTAPPTRFYCNTWNRFASRSTWVGFSLKNDLSPVREPQYLDDRTRDWFLVVERRLCIDECTIWNLLSKALRLGVSDMRHEKHRWAWRVYDQEYFKSVAFLKTCSVTRPWHTSALHRIYTHLTAQSKYCLFYFDKLHVQIAPQRRGYCCEWKVWNIELLGLDFLEAISVPRNLLREVFQ